MAVSLPSSCCYKIVRRQHRFHSTDSSNDLIAKILVRAQSVQPVGQNHIQFDPLSLALSAILYV
jgi:hypothetical protein